MLQDVVAGDDGIRLVFGFISDLPVYVAKILVAGLEQLFEAVDDEVGLLEVIDYVPGAHNALEIKADAIGRAVLEGEHRFVRR